MVEFWASVGLACFDREFYEELCSPHGEKPIQAVYIRLLRLSCDQVKELTKLLCDPKFAKLIKQIHSAVKESEQRSEWILQYRCPKPPLSCP